MYDKTQEKIINAATKLIIEKGYAATTTKQIAKEAGVNECTLFRRFGEKKEILLAALALPQWNPALREADFEAKGSVKKDLTAWAEIYMDRYTIDMMRLAAGLRSSDLTSEEMAPVTLAPQLFISVLEKYFLELMKKGKLSVGCDPMVAALQFAAMCHGFMAFSAEWGEEFLHVSREEYLKNSVKNFLKGVRGK